MNTMNSRIREAFDILELHEHATLEEAKQAWRDLAQVWHPDKHQHNERIQAKATDKLKAINSAWDEVQKWFAQQEQNEKDQTDEAHEEQERQRREADYKTYTCPHCGTMNRLPQNKPIESARCGKCAKFLSVVRESEELLKKERAEREQQNERERQKLRERQKERERQQALETRWEALRKQANTQSEELEVRLRQSAHPQQQGPWNRFALLVILVLLVLVGFMFYAEKKNENRTGNGRHAAEQAHAVSYGTIPSPKTETKTTPVSGNIKAKIINVVKAWNLAKDKHDTNALDAVYADNMKYYGMDLRKERVIKDTELFFKDNPSFSQFVDDDIHILEKSPGVYLAEFKKITKLESDNVAHFVDYDAYLVVNYNNAEGRLLIVTEGDTTTDLNLARMKKTRRE